MTCYHYTKRIAPFCVKNIVILYLKFYGTILHVWNCIPEHTEKVWINGIDSLGIAEKHLHRRNPFSGLSTLQALSHRKFPTRKSSLRTLPVLLQTRSEQAEILNREANKQGIILNKCSTDKLCLMIALPISRQRKREIN